MKRRCAIFLNLVLTLCDVVVTTVIFSHGTNFHYHFTVDLYMYDFSHSLFDLWIFTLIRSSVILGLICAAIYNPVAAIPRAKFIKKVVLLFSALMFMYIMAKLLGLSDFSENMHDAWMWGMLGWTAAASFLFYGEWILISSVTVLIDVKNINSDEETSPLLGNGSAGKESKEKSETAKAKRVPVRRLFSYMLPDWPLILVGFTFLILASAGRIFIPFYTGEVIDGIAIDKSKEKFTHAIITMSLITLGSAISAGIRGGCLSLVLSRLAIRLRNCLFASIMKQEVGFFDSVKTGDITSRLTSDTTTTSEALSLNMNIFLRSLITAGGVVFFMFKLSWRLTVVTFIGLPILLGVAHVYGNYYEKLAERVQDSLAKANSVAEEACSTMRTVRSFANEEGEITRYKKSLEDTYKLYKKESLAYAGYMWSTQILELALTVSVLYFGGHLVIADKLSGGNLVSFILYTLELSSALDSLASVYTGIMQAIGASHKVFEYIDRKPVLSTSAGKFIPDTLDGKMDFRDVSFAYPSRPETLVLKNISFTVKPGEIVALVGPSGGGKSSCVNLVEHFYETSTGDVLLDSVPIQDYDHKYLHKKIALVSQEPVLYGRTIHENIAYGLDECTDEQVKQAAILANADQFIMEMKDQYQTQTGEKGVQLSGGQKQRIAIARALIRDPRVLLLDEATSALDAESEHMVQQALYSNMSGRTVIIIAHRLSTVEKAHRIVVIEKGEVKEQGTHRELLARGGMYASLVKRQILGFDQMD
ncbi:ATP-binding cassette sub-family B member 9-like [Gigantopelta aegis]|uniref:ATP-binding cassette sub-family B member 9-like n=1 Tax=Gigantopelta aegis TaxID=1735272 RepID=UPI001B88C058|nr:ATP-binding cassette sub-family B member 9-like [Gigantopelta aegis]